MDEAAMDKINDKGWIMNIRNERIKYFKRPERRQVAKGVLKN